MIDAALPAARQPQTYIGPDEKTTTRSILEKVALFGILLGSGLLLAAFFTAIPLLVGAAVTALSAYALDYLSNIDSLMSDGSYRLIQAAKEGNRCMLKFLLCLGANPNIQPEFSALTNAVSRDHCDIVRDLLAAGADPDLHDDSNQTPLMEAVCWNQDGIVEILLANGADRTIRTRHVNPGGTPYEYAVRQEMLFQTPDGDHRGPGDPRTREERKAAATRIVNMLTPIAGFE